LYGVPWKYKDLQGKEKGLLRAAVEGLLPEEVLWRKKSPYPKTHDPVYLELVSSRLRQLLDDASSPLLHIVDRNALEALFDRESVWPWYGQLMRTPQTMAYFLQLDFWLRHYQVELMW
jgi:asparagine synthase (glutamine-hydrolysing)